jgi:hypothetical protein
VADVLIALADVGPGVQLEEQLVQSGVAAKWDQTFMSGPRPGPMPKVVLLDADYLGWKLPEVADAWRNHPACPGLVAIGMSPESREQAPVAHTILLAPTAKVTTVMSAIKDAARMRFATAMRWSMLRAACNLPPVHDTPAAWPETLQAARNIDIEIPKTALRWHANHYVAPTQRIDELRQERLLSVPELEAAAVIDGTRTVQTHVNAGPLDPLQTARFMWMLGSFGGLTFTPEIRDLATAPRRLLAELRAHLRARAQRLEKSTYYDVLEISVQAEYEQIEAAYQLVAMRYSPTALAGHDLAELRPTVQPMWDLVEKARLVLVDHAQRGRYHDWLRQKLPELRSVWAVEPKQIATANEAFVRGQAALGAGDVHKAMSELAQACRAFPGQPEYEANLAWARYRVQVASGRDRIEAALAERNGIEQLLLGCKPWPRALVPLALLCAAANDHDSARWHLHTALTVDPTVPAAAQLAQRLGMRR